MSENSWNQFSFHRNKSKSDERHSSARFTQWEPTEELTSELENTEQFYVRSRGHRSLEEMHKSFEEETPPPPPLLHVDDLSRDPSSLLSTACSCGSPQKMQEVMKINHHWHMDYTSLLEDHRKLESDYWKTKSLLGKAEYEKDELTKKMTKLEKDISTMTTEQTSSKMEALKLQCSVFQEDFNAERAEREKYARETLKLKAELKKTYGVIDNLAGQTKSLKSNIRSMSNEREELLTTLNTATTSRSFDATSTRGNPKLSYERQLSEPTRKRSIDDEAYVLNVEPANLVTFTPLRDHTKTNRESNRTSTKSTTGSSPPKRNRENFLTLMQRDYPNFQGGNPVYDLTRGAWE